MAIKIECDGDCGKVIPIHPRTPEHDDTCRGCRQGHDGHIVGQLDSAVFCGACLKKWEKYRAAEGAERVKVVKAFESWRVVERAKLRKTFTKLPDDWDAVG